VSGSIKFSDGIEIKRFHILIALAKKDTQEKT
jgi:hypothetical protein